MIFRLAQNLNTRINAGRTAASPLDDNPYADWSARLFVADRTPYILLSNTRSLYSTVMYGSGITSGHQFIVRAMSSIREFMQEDDLEFIYRTQVAPSAAAVRFCKALNRAVTGSQNELVAAARMWLAAGELSPHDVGFRLNDLLLSVLGDKPSGGYGNPREAFRRLR